jgi:hypothetical protein
MKKIISIAFAVGLVACGLLIQQAQAVIIDSGTGVLPSTTGGGAGTTLTASYSVDLTGAVYTYSYVVHNPATDTTNPDQFSVTFNANGTSVIAITSGTGIVNTGSSVTWFFAGVPAGSSSGTLSFTSPDAPIHGNAGANDSNPPAPWSTLATGGVPVDVPNVPDGGSAVALLGIAMAGIEGARRMIRARKA